jgi:hypothetical protein
MIMMAARTAAELPLRSDFKSLTQALAERPPDARAHRYLDHCHKRAGLERMAQRSLPFRAKAYAYLGCSSLGSKPGTGSRHRPDRLVAHQVSADVPARLWSSGTQDRVRTSRLRRDPRCTLFVFDQQFSWLALETTVALLEGPEAAAQNLRLFRVMQNRPSESLSWFGGELDEASFLQLPPDDDGGRSARLRIRHHPKLRPVLTISARVRSHQGGTGCGKPGPCPGHLPSHALSPGPGAVRAFSSAAASRLRNGPTRCPSWAGCRNRLSWLTVYRVRRPVRVRVR